MKGRIMGRAIDMENDISALKIQVEKLENTVRGMVSKLDELLDELDEKSTKTKHIDLTEVKDEAKETNDEGDANSSKPTNKRSRKPKSNSK
jgi:predicted glycosyltransferase